MKHRKEPDEPGDDARRARRRRRARLLRTAALSVVGALGGVVVAADVQVPVGPFTSTFLARPALDGRTTVSLAPLGTIRLDTHDAPLAIDVRVEELRLDEAELIARDPAVLERFESDVVADAKSALRGLAVRTALAALLGALAGALVGSLAWRSLLVGGVIGTGLLAGGLGATLGSWRAEAVMEPRYTGLLTIAPKAVGDVEAVIERFGEYRAQLAQLVENVITLYGVGADLPGFDPLRATTRLLHVSDVHLNPQAFDLMRRVVTQFDVDAVVDTGDTTDWGSEPESQLLDQISRLGVPYVWVRGNHDSRRTQDVVAAQPNGVVLDGDARDVAGLRMWGLGDPRYTPDKSQPVGKDVERDQAAAAAPGVAATLRAVMPPPVDVVVVHDARLAAEVGDLTPLVLAGHTHEPRQSSLGKATLLVQGSTGGAGLRGLQGDEPEPLTCSVLYFDATTRALVAYDRITVEGLGQTGVRIERHTLGQSLRPSAHPPTTTEPGATVATTSTTAP